MRSRFRPPMLGVALLLLGVIALLATLQYRWLGQISEAERERMKATMRTGATEFAQDFDRELTRAYLLFQMEPADAVGTAVRFAGRYDQWQGTSRFPRLLKDYYVFTQDPAGDGLLRRFDPQKRTLERAEWPEAMKDWRSHLFSRDFTSSEPGSRAMFIARMSHPIWEEVPALVTPMSMPLLLVSDKDRGSDQRPSFSYAILTIDLDYVKREMLPSLAERHFSRGGAGLDFDVAVLRPTDGSGIIYSSSQSFAPGPDATGDATTELFQVRTQDFGGVAAEVRRFTAFAATAPSVQGGAARWIESVPSGSPPADLMTFREARPLSIYVQASPDSPPSRTVATRIATAPAPRWKLVLRHPSGSLEAAVGSLRRRNLIVSSSILGVLGASMSLLILSTRRAQRLARQQMEFVATVSHELRTPLAVIRSASENLADGVVRDDEQIRKYGELLRNEGRRLTEMVEQILEFAGIQSGQRSFALRHVGIAPLLEEIVRSSASLLAQAAMKVDLGVSTDLPPVLGDEAALRRAFQNLVSNAIKYGASGGWVGITAARSGSNVEVSVADRGMGIAAAEQARIFEPFYRASEAVSAQIQGAGLGLSLVQRIVEAHGGQVTVTSAPGEGARFTVLLPAAGSEPARERLADTRSAEDGPAFQGARAARFN